MLPPHEQTIDGADAHGNVALGLACTLPPTRRDARRADIGTLLERANDRRVEPDGVTLSFAWSDVLARTLLEFVLAERQCCPQMTYELRFPASDVAVELRVRSPAEHLLAVRTLYGELPSDRNRAARTGSLLGAVTRTIAWLLLSLVSVVGHVASAQSTTAAGHRATRQVIDEWVTREESQLVGIADAMPAGKYTFAPTEGEFTGVRTFVQQVKHVAAANYILAAGMLGENPPVDAGDETGPDSLRTKAAVVEYLKASFAYLHAAVSGIGDQNPVIPTPGISPLQGRATKLGLAVEALMHGLDHYGQMVEYLRMNGIVPPASRL